MEKVEFVLGPSKKLGIFLGVLYISTALVVFFLPVFWIIKILINIGLGWYCWRNWNLHGSRSSKKSIIRIWQDPRGFWGCQTKEGHLAMGKLKGDSFRSIWLIVLRIRFQSRVVSVVIVADALSKAAYRILSARMISSL